MMVRCDGATGFRCVEHIRWICVFGRQGLPRLGSFGFDSNSGLVIFFSLAIHPGGNLFNQLYGTQVPYVLLDDRTAKIFYPGRSRP